MIMRKRYYDLAKERRSKAKPLHNKRNDLHNSYMNKPCWFLENRRIIENTRNSKFLELAFKIPNEACKRIEQ